MSSEVPTATPTRGEQRRLRLIAANQFVAAIANAGDLFQHDGNTGHFVLGVDRVFWIDEYTRAKVYTHTKRAWYRFSHGSRVRGLVESLRDYIMSGTALQQATWRTVLAQHSYTAAGIDDLVAHACLAGLMTKDAP